MLYVFFHRAAKHWPSPRVATRQWDVYRRAKISRWTKMLIGEPVHCSIGNHTYGILDSGPDGHRLYDFAGFVDECRTLTGWFEVEHDPPEVDLRPWSAHYRRRRWSYDAQLMLKYLTRGHFRVDDCVNVTRQVLMRRCVQTPWAWKPAQVHFWLDAYGYPFFPAGPAARPLDGASEDV